MLGMNVASQMSITVRALQQLGVDVRGLTNDNNANCSHAGLRSLATTLNRRQRLRAGYLSTSLTYNVLSEIARSDIIQWNYAEPALGKGADLRFASLLRKPGIVEFWGSDVRINSIAERDNPYYAARGAAYEYQKHETREDSWRRQELFASNGVLTCLAPPWFEPYIKPGLFKKVHDSFARLVLSDFPHTPVADTQVPVIAHAPSARGAKGTDAVLEAVGRLQKRFDFEFVLLHGIPREEVLRAVRNCDIFLDQFIIGEYGMASLEAMAFGKPTVCYLRSEVIRRSPAELPIVNATPDDLYDRVAELLENRDLRARIGKESRRYIEAHHDALKYAKWLTGVYDEVITSSRNRQIN
jgi:hypothetical protein